MADPIFCDSTSLDFAISALKKVLAKLTNVLKRIFLKGLYLTLVREKNFIYFVE